MRQPAAHLQIRSSRAWSSPLSFVRSYWALSTWSDHHKISYIADILSVCLLLKWRDSSRRTKIGSMSMCVVMQGLSRGGWKEIDWGDRKPREEENRDLEAKCHRLVQVRSVLQTTDAGLRGANICTLRWWRSMRWRCNAVLRPRSQLLPQRKMKIVKWISKRQRKRNRKRKRMRRMNSHWRSKSCKERNWARLWNLAHSMTSSIVPQNSYKKS